jgi:hypothetical protein
MIGKLGPHEGYELELMLSGRKKIAFFQDYVPHEEFAPHVSSGAIVQEMHKEPDWDFAFTYYALADHAHLIGELHGLIDASYLVRGEAQDAIERKIGRLLGYDEKDIDYYIARRQERRAAAASSG